MKKLAKRKKRTEYTNKYALHTEHKFHFKIGEVKETVMEWMKERKKKVGTSSYTYSHSPLNLTYGYGANKKQ